TRDPAPGSYQLTQVALRGLPDVIVNAGQVSALAALTRGSDARLVVAQDRLTRAAGDVSTGLRAGTEPGADYVVGLNLLGPLDEDTGGRHGYPADGQQAGPEGPPRIPDLVDARELLPRQLAR